MKSVRRKLHYKGFVLETGEDGLITILDENGVPLSADMKFLRAATACSFVDHWLAAQELRKK